MPTLARRRLPRRGAARRWRARRGRWTATPGRRRRGWTRSSGARENLWSRGIRARAPCDPRWRSPTQRARAAAARIPSTRPRRPPRQHPRLARRRACCCGRCSRSRRTREARPGVVGSAGAGWGGAARRRPRRRRRRSAQCAWRSSAVGTCWCTCPARTASTGPAPCLGSRPPRAAPSAAPRSTSPPPADHPARPAAHLSSRPRCLSGGTEQGRRRETAKGARAMRGTARPGTRAGGVDDRAVAGRLWWPCVRGTPRVEAAARRTWPVLQRLRGWRVPAACVLLVWIIHRVRLLLISLLG